MIRNCRPYVNEIKDIKPMYFFEFNFVFVKILNLVKEYQLGKYLGRWNK